jgi:hypothetical protein
MKMEKIMKHVNLQFWGNLFKTMRKTFYNKTIENPPHNGCKNSRRQATTNNDSMHQYNNSEPKMAGEILGNKETSKCTSMAQKRPSDTQQRKRGGTTISMQLQENK